MPWSRERVPSFPNYVDAEHHDCRSCRFLPGGMCVTDYEYGCGGDSCRKRVECASSCCAESGVALAELDQGPWASWVEEAQQGDEVTGFVGLTVASSGGVAIAAIPAAGGEPVRLTEPDPQLERALWSGSGRYAAIVRPKLGPLRVLDLRRGVYDAFVGSIPLAPLGWAGDHLVLVSRRQLDPPDDSEPRVAIPDEILMLDWEGGEMSTREPRRTSLDSYPPPTLSPDTAYSVYASDKELVFVSLEDGVEHRTLGSEAGIEHPVWHPSGAFVGFWRDDYSEAQTRYHLTLARPGAAAVAPTGLSITAPIAFELEHAFSSDGHFVAYVAPTTGDEIELRVARLGTPGEGVLIGHTTQATALGWISAEHADAVATLARAPLPSPSRAELTPEVP